MKYTPGIEKALKKAAFLHKDQMRKNSGVVPFIIHPFSVALILSDYTNDEDLIIACLLHDTIEDTQYLPQELEKDFGKRVKDIVMGTTEIKKDKSGTERPWRERKEDYIKNLWEDSEESLLLSCADKIHNMYSYINEYQEIGPGLFKKFNSTPKENVWYHEEILKVLESKIKNHGMIEKYKELLVELKKISE